MAKDALGHGSEGKGAHAAPINNLPSKGTSSWSSGVSDATWHAQQPIGQYTGHIADLIGMWGGAPNMQPGKLTPEETAQVNSEYEHRTDPHVVAGAIHALRQTRAYHDANQFSDEPHSRGFPSTRATPDQLKNIGRGLAADPNKARWK
jgi:hypothetical protein